MKRFLIVFSLFCFLGSPVYAEVLPISDDFNFADGYNITNDGYIVSRDQKSDDYYAAVENGRMKMHTPAGEYYWICAAKSITSIDRGMLYIDYTLNIPMGNTLMVLRGLPVAEDADGNTQPLIKAMGTGNFQISGSKVSDMTLECDRDYKLRFAVDYDKKEYKLYVDSGTGYVQKHTENGQMSFAYDIGAVKRISFYIESIPNRENTITVDDVRVYTDQKYFYVSPNGNDNDIGSIDAPFGTIEKAVAAAAEYDGKSAVKLFSGAYSVPENSKMGEADVNDMPYIITISPISGEKVEFYGAYNRGDMPYVIEDNGFIDKFYSDIENNVAQCYSTEPIKVSDVVFGDENGNAADENSCVYAKFNVINRNVSNEKAAMIFAFYNSEGVLLGTDICNIDAEGQAVTEFDHKLNIPASLISSERIKIFLWNNLNDLIPVRKAEPGRSVEVAKKGSVIEASASFDKSGALLCSGHAAANAMVTIKVTKSDGEVVYIDQTEAGAQGEFELLCNLKKLSVAEYVFSVYATD